MYLDLYKKHWKIEEMFRTLKQSLGLKDCSSTQLEKYDIHINFGFLSYAFLEYEKNIHNFENPEAAIKHLRTLKIDNARTRIDAFCRNFRYAV